MIQARTVFLVLGLCLVGAIAQDCSDQVMQDSFQVSFERKRSTGEIKSLETVEVTFDYGKVQTCFGDEEEPTLFIHKGETWEEITGGRKRRSRRVSRSTGSRRRRSHSRNVDLVLAVKIVEVVKSSGAGCILARRLAVGSAD